MDSPLVAIIVAALAIAGILLWELVDRRWGPALDRILDPQLPDTAIDYAKREAR